MVIRFKIAVDTYRLAKSFCIAFTISALTPIMVSSATCLPEYWFSIIWDSDIAALCRDQEEVMQRDIKALAIVKALSQDYGFHGNRRLEKMAPVVRYLYTTRLDIWQTI